MIFGQKYLNEQKKEYATNNLQIFLHINYNLTRNERKTCLCGGDTNAMRELDKQNNTEKKKKSCPCTSFLPNSSTSISSRMPGL
jgi:hypothetical protein